MVVEGLYARCLHQESIHGIRAFNVYYVLNHSNKIVLKCK